MKRVITGTTYSYRNPTVYDNFKNWAKFPFKREFWEELYRQTVVGRPANLFDLFRAIALTFLPAISTGFSYTPAAAGGGIATPETISLTPDIVPTTGLPRDPAVGFLDLTIVDYPTTLGLIRNQIDTLKLATPDIAEKAVLIDRDYEGDRMIWDGIMLPNGHPPGFVDEMNNDANGAQNSDQGLDFLLFCQAADFMGIQFADIDQWFNQPPAAQLRTSDGESVDDLLQAAKSYSIEEIIAGNTPERIARGRRISNRLVQRKELPFGRVLQVGVDELRIQLMPELGADLPATDAAA